MKASAGGQIYVMGDKVYTDLTREDFVSDDEYMNKRMKRAGSGTLV